MREPVLEVDHDAPTDGASVVPFPLQRSSALTRIAAEIAGQGRGARRALGRLVAERGAALCSVGVPLVHVCEHVDALETALEGQVKAARAARRRPRGRGPDHAA